MLSRDMLALFGGWGRENCIFRLRDAGFNVVAVIVPRKKSDRLARCVSDVRNNGFTVVECGKPDLENALRGFATADTLLSIGFPFLLTPKMLALFPLCLNVHPTLLPKYRGPSSGAYILINGERYTGSTVHIIDKGMDTGPIVLQSKVEISRFDTVRSMQRKVYAIEPQLVVDALDLVATDGFVPAAQDETQASTFAKKRAPADSEIDPSRPLSELYDTIRACDPDDFPAFFLVDGQKVCIRMWRPDKSDEDDKDTI